MDEEMKFDLITVLNSRPEMIIGVDSTATPPQTWSSRWCSYFFGGRNHKFWGQNFRVKYPQKREENIKKSVIFWHNPYATSPKKLPPPQLFFLFFWHSNPFFLFFFLVVWFCPGSRGTDGVSFLVEKLSNPYVLILCVRPVEFFLVWDSLLPKSVLFLRHCLHFLIPVSELDG